ncbi:seven transmembrane receptor-like protein [Schizosaccharomyces pombe]|uniref:Uncharacterized membrane protein C18A7.02c n=1 Tax=Schizosaccharomyces pombe (strain 972 / ATCC 24843) TaxID=284812 RepID=YOD2_SCHPO|nr:putative seven transmembrane receptor-like protein [Schizosaccharomyces pombe]Q9Y7Y9.1 RecName: Full=Uncharacterized membrane protein C18A7.02c; Flags: Precursor [Schizosaccharomyces pombe 972h-]CAB45934.1 seven transmembrane receptor-like protein (predicted) [Schizosaccharomyces pombe]|eukprot:NP_596120.1 putative seven transmembrane receptor-like protein [Schizosaccharomyces pombe]
MKLLISLLWSIFFSIVYSEKTLLNFKHYELCNGIYSKSESGGSLNPAIYVNWTEPWGQEDEVEVLIFNWKEIRKLGAFRSDDQFTYICDYDAVYTDHLCEADQLGLYLWNSTSAKSIRSYIIPTNADPQNIIYEISQSGYYCIWSHSKKMLPYQALVNWQNAYGGLPASQFPRMPISGGITIAYSVILALWMFFRFQYKHSIVTVQKAIMFLLIFSCAQQAVTSIVLDTENLRNRGNFTWLGETLVSILFACQLVLDLALLLILSWGYTRYSTNMRDRLFTEAKIPLIICFFALFVVRFFAITIQSIHLGLWFCFFFLTACISALYILFGAFVALPSTLRALVEQRYYTLHSIYKIFRIMVLCGVVTIFSFSLVALIFCSNTNNNSTNKLWKIRWYFLDGWIDGVHLTYLITLSSLWRPSQENPDLDPTGLSYPVLDPRLEEELDLLEEDIRADKSK